MIFHAFQREDDDAVFTIVRNISGAALVVGYVCAWSTSTPDGVRVSSPAASGLSLFRGIAVEAIADSAYGKVQVHGYCSQALVSNDTTITYTAGTPLVPVATAVYLDYAGNATTADGVGGFVCLAEAVATAATTQVNKKVFIRAL
jgi:hypothetical protein